VHTCFLWDALNEIDSAADGRHKQVMAMRDTLASGDLEASGVAFFSKTKVGVELHAAALA